MIEQTTKRFRIDHWHVVDSEFTPTKKYYIREVLDVGSHEFTSSKLTSQKRLDMISDLGLDTLTAVLDNCFRSNGRDPVEYNASKCAEAALFISTKAVERSKSN